MTVFLVGAGPGDPGLLTRRGAALLAAADVVVHDRLIDPAVLSLASAGAELIDVGKRPDDPGGGAVRQEEIHDLLVKLGRTGQSIVRLKGGDPFLFGRGGEEAEALTAAGVAWEIVPGVTSAFAVPALAGIPVTHRGLSTSVTVVSGRVGAGAEASESGIDWESLARAGGTLVVLMGVATRAGISRRLLDAGKPPETPVTVVERGTTPDERIVCTTLATLPTVDVEAPSVFVIGDVASLGLSSSSAAAGNLHGKTVVVTRPKNHNEPLASVLTAAGARVIELPLLEITTPDDGGKALRRAVADLSSHRWVAFTSVNAVERFFAALRDGRDLAGLGLAAVGPATAAALAGRHLTADILSDPATAAALAAAMPDAVPEVPAGTPPKVLFPCAEGAGSDLTEGLAAKGWQVDRVVAYKTVPSPPPPRAVADALGTADAIIFSSPSGVIAYEALREEQGCPLNVPELVICAGPTTAGAARAAAMPWVEEAETPAAPGILAALLSAFASRDGS